MEDNGMNKKEVYPATPPRINKEFRVNGIFPKKREEFKLKPS